MHRSLKTIIIKAVQKYITILKAHYKYHKNPPQSHPPGATDGTFQIIIPHGKYIETFSDLDIERVRYMIGAEKKCGPSKKEGCQYSSTLEKAGNTVMYWKKRKLLNRARSTITFDDNKRQALKITDNG